MNVTVRPSTRTDVEALVALDTVARHDRARAEIITRWCRAGAALVAEIMDTPVGYCVLEYTFFEQGFVSMLFVAEPARRKGIGTALLTAACAACTTQKLFTSTNLSNHAMHRMLEQAGWLPVGMLHGLDEGDPEVFYLHAQDAARNQAAGATSAGSLLGFRGYDSRDHRPTAGLADAEPEGVVRSQLSRRHRE
jgi:GNAT superfamily N-acetyltransferase